MPCQPPPLPLSRRCVDGRIGSLSRAAARRQTRKCARDVGIGAARGSDLRKAGEFSYAHALDDVPHTQTSDYITD